jgi:AraC-like DNA-binding protein
MAKKLPFSDGMKIGGRRKKPKRQRVQKKVRKREKMSGFWLYLHFHPNIAIMDKKEHCIEVTTDVINDIAINNAENNGQNLIRQNITLLSDTSLFRKSMPLRQPYRTMNPQISIVTQGTAEFNINLVNYKLHKGDLLLLPINTLFHVRSKSEDYNSKLLDFNLPHNNKLLLFVLQLRKTTLDDKDFLRINRYFELIQDCFNSTSENMWGVAHLVMALLYDADNILSSNQKQATLLKREEVLYSEFMQLLLREYETLPRTLEFYAETLKVTPNHLGITVKKVSGYPPLHWINKVSIEQSKFLLINDKLSISDIAFKVGFADQTSFSRFFKKETGISPLDYRKQQLEAMLQQG